ARELLLLGACLRPAIHRDDRRWSTRGEPSAVGVREGLAKLVDGCAGLRAATVGAWAVGDRDVQASVEKWVAAVRETLGAGAARHEPDEGERDQKRSPSTLHEPHEDIVSGARD